MAQGEFVPIQNFDMESTTGRARPLNFDLFVHLPLNEKYVLLRKRGQLLEDTRVAKLAEQNVRNLFIRRTDHTAFVQHVAVTLREILSMKSTDRERAGRLAARSLLNSTLITEDSVTMQAMMSNLYEITSTIIESVMESSNLGTRKAFRALAELSQKGSSLQRHPVNVASLAVLIAFGIGYTAEKTLYYLSVAALLHDIGFSKLPPRLSLHAHDPQSLTTAEREELHRHPDLAIDLLRERGLKLPQPVLGIIAHHHELVNGKGYPLGLRGTQVNELVQILQIADELDDRIIEPVRAGINLKLRVHHLFEKISQERRIAPLLLGRVRGIIL